MILYHGSIFEVREPDLTHSRPRLDFGRGFYTTPIYRHAKEWAEQLASETEGERGIVSVYQLDDNAFADLNCLSFDSHNVDWLNFVSICRKGKDTSCYDIVTGGIADDKVFNTVELYLNRFISKREAIRRLKFRNPNQQVCFRTPVALSRLVFQESRSL